MSKLTNGAGGPAWRQRLAAFADHLIPGGAGLPSASAAEVHTVMIDRALECRPDLSQLISGVIDGSSAPGEELERLRNTQPGVFDKFAFAIAAVYFLNPEVRRLVGYPGAAPQRKAAKPGEAEDYLRDGLLDPVVARGPIYRPTPKAMA